MESNLIFHQWRQRCSSLGHIMTNLPLPITPEEEAELANLLQEFQTGVNANGNKTKWTETKDTTVKKLQKKKKGDDELPSGAITHLEDVFRSLYWKRKRFLSNRYLEKGLLMEQNSLALKSKADNVFYVKNDVYYENDFIQGNPDNYQQKVRDTKSNYDLKTFDEAELTKDYEWQIKGYSWLIKEQEKLDYFPEGELVYCLVNNPVSHIENERNRLFYQLGCPNEDNDKWIEIQCQLERNMIFDIAEFKNEFPHYVFKNTFLNFDMPAHRRVKTFDVLTTEDDVFNIKRRVLLSRKYLMEKEIKENELYKNQ